MYIYIYNIHICKTQKQPFLHNSCSWTVLTSNRVRSICLSVSHFSLRPACCTKKQNKKHFMKFWNLLPHHKMGISIIQWEVQLKIGQQKSLPGSRQGPLLSFWCYLWIGGRQCYLPSTNHSINANERKPHNLIQFNLSCVCVPISRDVVNKYAQKDLFCGAGVLWNFHE